MTLWWSRCYLTLCCFVVYSTRLFVVCLSVCHFVLVFFSPFSIAITSLGEERADISALRTFVQFVLVWICRFPLPLGVWEGLRFVIVALPGLFSYLFFVFCNTAWMSTTLEQCFCRTKVFNFSMPRFLAFINVYPISSSATSCLANEAKRGFLL